MRSDDDPDQPDAEDPDPFSGPEPPELALLTPRERQELARAKRWALWIGLILPLGLSLAAAAIMFAWLPRTPDPMASHWAGPGRPTDFMSPMGNLLSYAGLGIGLSALFGTFALLGGGQMSTFVWSALNRGMAAFCVALVGTVMAAGVLSTGMQLDLVDAGNAPDNAGMMGAAFVFGIVAGAIAFVVQPRVRIEARDAR